MVTAVIANSAAGNRHPDDPSLQIPLFSQVSASGLPDPNMEGTHAYGYDSSGRMLTDDWTVNGGTYRKTWSYNSSGVVSGKVNWVKVA